MKGSQRERSSHERRSLGGTERWPSETSTVPLASCAPRRGVAVALPAHQAGNILPSCSQTLTNPPPRLCYPLPGTIPTLLWVQRRASGAWRGLRGDGRSLSDVAVGDSPPTSSQRRRGSPVVPWCPRLLAAAPPAPCLRQPSPSHSLAGHDQPILNKSHRLCLHWSRFSDFSDCSGFGFSI